MFCPHCGKPLDSGFKFCTKCGTKLDLQQNIAPPEVDNPQPTAIKQQQSPQIRTEAQPSPTVQQPMYVQTQSGFQTTQTNMQGYPATNAYPAQPMPNPLTGAATPPVKNHKGTIKKLFAWALVAIGALYLLSFIYIMTKAVMGDEDNMGTLANAKMNTLLILLYVFGCFLFGGISMLHSMSKKQHKSSNETHKQARADLIDSHTMPILLTAVVTMLSVMLPLAETYNGDDILAVDSLWSLYFTSGFSEIAPRLKMILLVLCTVGMALTLTFPRTWSKPLLNTLSLAYVIVIAGIFEDFALGTLKETYVDYLTTKVYCAMDQPDLTVEWNQGILILLSVGFLYHLWHSFHGPLRDIWNFSGFSARFAQWPQSDNLEDSIPDWKTMSMADRAIAYTKHNKIQFIIICVLIVLIVLYLINIKNGDNQFIWKDVKLPDLSTIQCASQAE